MTKASALAVALAVLVLCGGAWAQDAGIPIPPHQVDQALRAKLPREVLDAGEMVSVNNGSFPPYEIVTGNRSMTGASAELQDALGELLGVRIRHETVSGLSAIWPASGPGGTSSPAARSATSRSGRPATTSSIGCGSTWCWRCRPGTRRASAASPTPAAAASR